MLYGAAAYERLAPGGTHYLPTYLFPQGGGTHHHLLRRVVARGVFVS